MKMGFIPCISIVHRLICWKIFPITDNEVNSGSIYWHGKRRNSYCLNRLLHEVMGCVPAIILMIFFCKVKIFPLLGELSQKIIRYFITEWKYV
jgi:hypothetical protein